MLKKLKRKAHKSFFTIYAAILVALVLFLYLPVINFGFIADDFWLVPLSFEDSMSATLTTVHFRPIWFSSYPTINAIFGNSSYVHHGANLSLHLLNCLLAISITKKFLNGSIALILVALWTLLPWVAFPITWISQRNDLLMSFFILLALHPLVNKRYIIYTLVAVSFFAKVTSLFFFIAFCLKSGLKRQKVDFFYGILGFFVALGVSFFAVYNRDLQNHLSDLSSTLILLNYLKNFFVGWFTLFIPLPFLFTTSNILAYVVFFSSLIWVALKYGEITSHTKRYLLFAFLMSIPQAMSYDLRITYLQSLFILVALFSSLYPTFVEKKNGTPKHGLAFGFTVVIFLIFAVPALQTTLDKFNTANHILSSDRTGLPGGNYYPNDFYPWFRNFQITLLETLRN